MMSRNKSSQPLSEECHFIVFTCSKVWHVTLERGNFAPYDRQMICLHLKGTWRSLSPLKECWDIEKWDILTLFWRRLLLFHVGSVRLVLLLSISQRDGMEGRAVQGCKPNCGWGKPTNPGCWCWISWWLWWRAGGELLRPLLLSLLLVVLALLLVYWSVSLLELFEARPGLYCLTDIPYLSIAFTKHTLTCCFRCWNVDRQHPV